MAVQRTLLDGDTGAKFSSLELLVGEALNGGGGAALTNVKFVDGGAAPGGDGSIGKPFQTLGAANAALPNGGAILVTPGDYSEDVLFNIADKSLSIVALGDHHQVTLTFLSGVRLTTTGAAASLHLQEVSANGTTFTVVGTNVGSISADGCILSGGTFNGAVAGPLALDFLDTFASGITTTNLAQVDMNGTLLDGTVGMFNAPGLIVNLKNVEVSSPLGITFPGGTGVVNVDATANFWYSTNGTTTGGSKVIQASVT